MHECRTMALRKNSEPRSHVDRAQILRVYQPFFLVLIWPTGMVGRAKDPFNPSTLQLQSCDTYVASNRPPSACPFQLRCQRLCNCKDRVVW